MIFSNINFQYVAIVLSMSTATVVVQCRSRITLQQTSVCFTSKLMIIAIEGPSPAKVNFDLCYLCGNL